MVEHLPECSGGWFDTRCICVELSECEQRVTGHLRESKYKYRNWYDRGYTEALRDAVTTIEADSEFDDIRDQWHAIDIIEALGGER